MLYLLDHPADLGIVLVLDRLVELLQTKCLKRELLSLGALDLATYLLIFIVDIVLRVYG